MWDALRRVWQTYDNPETAILARIGQIERECKRPTQAREEIPLGSRELGDTLGLLLRRLPAERRLALMQHWSSDPYDRCRTVLANALVWVGGPEALAALQQLSSDRCDETRLAARRVAIALCGERPAVHRRPRSTRQGGSVTHRLRRVNAK